jgi:ATP-binding cassette subfamily B protein
MSVADGRVDFNHVFFAYNDDKYVLKDVDYHFKAGETIGVLGSTGAGKTTLISLIARLYDVNKGSVEVGGVDVKKYDLVTLRDSVAVVLQKNTLFTGTIKDNLLWGNPNATDEEIAKACDLAQVTSFLKDLPDGLLTKLDEGGTNVSGGQKQRICIARALLKNPKVLILDDSTSACDTHTDALIRQGLSSERKDVTKFVIAQRVLSVKDCDTILVMNEGVVVASGTSDELLKSCAVYKELYQSQLGGGDFDARN